MANLGQKGGVYVARFRFQGKEYKKSLGTGDRAGAQAALAQVELTLHRLLVGLVKVPAGVDPGDYVVSGGTLEAPVAKAPVRAVPSVSATIDAYLANLGHLAPSNRSTVGTHLRNLAKKLGTKAKAPVDRVEQRDLEAFLQARLRERSHTTVAKERATAIGLFAWAVGQGYLERSPAASLTKVKSGGDAPVFRTAAEIGVTAARGGLTKAEEWALWDGLYLTPAEISGVLALVRERGQVGLVLRPARHPRLHRPCAAGEVLRLRWADVEFDQGGLVARSKKQSRQAVETKRRIDLHPELKAILTDWQAKRPRGQYVVCHAGSVEALLPAEANRRLWQPLRGTAWCLASRRNRFKIGFHTYRHSFASNLAAAGVDQRVIDEFMGHTTEAMRKRYRHLLPSSRRSAIESFSLSQGAI